MLGKRFLVTGGAGFIGSAFIRHGLKCISFCEKIVNLDLLTYAGNCENLVEIKRDNRYIFIKGDIRDQNLVKTICQKYEIDAIVHFAAETHVDRSISNPRIFFETNIDGTLSLLEVVRQIPSIHFHHISTDEIYGSLLKTGYFTENTPFSPNSPYAASKASSDQLVQSFAHTYGISMTISRASNNFGPYQYLEKFIPRMIGNSISQTPFPIYGKGVNIRDWLYVEDHVEAIWLILEKSQAYEIYNIGASSERQNLEILYLLIEMIARVQNIKPEALYSLITFVPDRPGHDFRYAVDWRKIRDRLGWQPRYELKEALEKTVDWYLNHPQWLIPVL